MWPPGKETGISEIPGLFSPCFYPVNATPNLPPWEASPVLTSFTTHCSGLFKSRRWNHKTHSIVRCSLSFIEKTTQIGAHSAGLLMCPFFPCHIEFLSFPFHLSLFLPDAPYLFLPHDFFFPLVVLGIQPRTLHMLGKTSTIELHLQPIFLCNTWWNEYIIHLSILLLTYSALFPF